MILGEICVLGLLVEHGMGGLRFGVDFSGLSASICFRVFGFARLLISWLLDF